MRKYGGGEEEDEEEGVKGWWRWRCRREDGWKKRLVMEGKEGGRKRGGMGEAAKRYR